MMTDDQMTGRMGQPAGPETEAQATPGPEEGSFFIPSDFLGGRTFKAGDTLKLQVMGTDKDGDLEVCFPGEGGNWQSELRSELNNAKGA